MKKTIDIDTTLDESEIHIICPEVTEDREFIVKHKLYELEELLPDHFVRVSKSTILNACKVYSITCSLHHHRKARHRIAAITLLIFPR